MMTDLSLETLDTDGALREALDGVHAQSRGDFLRGALIGSGGLLAALAAAPTAGASTARDVSIFNYALVLEYLQAAFYTEVERIGALRGPLAEQARVVGAHERAHVTALRKVLGQAAVKRPFFNFQGATEDADKFRKTAVAFEDLATAAYKGQAPLIQSRALLVAALALHSVEARHAAWIRRLAGIVPAASAFDEPLSRERTLAIVNSTHFIVRTRGKGSPRFTG
jgi:Ferritin-like domain